MLLQICEPDSAILRRRRHCTSCRQEANHHHVQHQDRRHHPNCRYQHPCQLVRRCRRCLWHAAVKCLVVYSTANQSKGFNSPLLSSSHRVTLAVRPAAGALLGRASRQPARWIRHHGLTLLQQRPRLVLSPCTCNKSSSSPRFASAAAIRVLGTAGRPWVGRTPSCCALQRG